MHIVTTEPARKSVTLSYGALALALLGTLLLGLLSGAVIGALLRQATLGRSPLATGQVPGANRPWIGITYVPITAGVARSKNLPVTSGALIVAITPNSPAQQAGLHESDIVTTVDQSPITETVSLMDLLMSKQPGDHVVLGILRDNNTQSVDITLGRSPGGGQQGGWFLDRLFRR
jgi:S1-C subfamily serine protease